MKSPFTAAVNSPVVTVNRTRGHAASRYRNALGSLQRAIRSHLKVYGRRKYGRGPVTSVVVFIEPFPLPPLFLFLFLSSFFCVPFRPYSWFSAPWLTHIHFDPSPISFELLAGPSFSFPGAVCCSHSSAGIVHGRGRSIPSMLLLLAYGDG